MLDMQQRLLPPVVFLVCLLAAGSIAFLVPGPTLVPMPWNGVGLTLIVAGIFLLVAGSQRFTRSRTNINTFLDPNHLVTDGVFRLSRNPMYLGFALTLLGVCVGIGAATPFLAWLVFVLVCQVWYIPFEEARCEAVFGDEYRKYRSRTRRWL